jgi:hypothetical protein
LAKATKLFKEKSPKADKLMSLIVDTKAVKMSVHHEVKPKTEKIVDTKAVKMSVYHKAKAEKMSVHHVVKAKTEKIVDTKAVKMSVHHDTKAKMTEKMFDGKAGKKHSISIHSYGAKSTKGVLEHDGIFQLRD